MRAEISAPRDLRGVFRAELARHVLDGRATSPAWHVMVTRFRREQREHPRTYTPTTTPPPASHASIPAPTSAPVMNKAASRLEVGSLEAMRQRSYGTGSGVLRWVVDAK
jgi:hypothetical protein